MTHRCQHDVNRRPITMEKVFGQVFYIIIHIMYTINLGAAIQDGMIANSCFQWHRNEFESGKFFLVVSFHFFDSKSTISRFGEHFCDSQYSLFLFAVLLLAVPPCAQPLVKVCVWGGEVRAPRALWSRRHWLFHGSASKQTKISVDKRSSLHCIVTRCTLIHLSAEIFIGRKAQVVRSTDWQLVSKV